MLILTRKQNESFTIFLPNDAIQQLALGNKAEESESLMDATVHWLRHSGISDDVKT